jgi:hypothetical protein
MKSFRIGRQPALLGMIADIALKGAKVETKARRFDAGQYCWGWGLAIWARATLDSISDEIRNSRLQRHAVLFSLSSFPVDLLMRCSREHAGQDTLSYSCASSVAASSSEKGNGTFIPV